MIKWSYKTLLEEVINRRICPLSQGAFVLNRLLSKSYGPHLAKPLYSYSEIEFTDFLIEHLILPVSEIYLRSIRGEETKLVTMRFARDICRTYHSEFTLALVESEVINWLNGTVDELAHYGKNHNLFHNTDSADLKLMHGAARSFDLATYWSNIDSSDKERISILMWRKIRRNKAFDYQVLAERLEITEAEAKNKRALNPDELARMLRLSLDGIHRLFAGVPTPLERNALIVNSYCMQIDSIEIVKGLGRGQAEIMLLAAGVGVVRTDLVGLNLQSIADDMEALRKAYDEDNDEDSDD